MEIGKTHIAMINTIQSTFSKPILCLLMILLPIVVAGQSLIKGPRWYDEGKLSRRLNLDELVENQEIPLFEQCLDGEFHVSVQLKYDIEGRKAFKDWEAALNVELMSVKTFTNGTKEENQLLIGASGANADGKVELKVSNNEEQTFVASALYGRNQEYISCNDEELGFKLEYFVRVTNLPSQWDGIPKEDLYLEFRLYEKPRYWLDYEGDSESEAYYLKTRNTTGVNYNDIQFDVRETAEDERILATWEYAEGAWGYELEWIFIGDDEFTAWNIMGPYDSKAVFEARYKDPIRVETLVQHYEVTNTYSAGELFFRVRGVGRFSENRPDQVTTGDWVYYSQAISTEGFSRNIADGTGSFNMDITWQVVTTFAEEGKSKKVVTFYDGSLRPRQVVTDLNTDDNTLVAETYYDYEGRATINVLPIPDPSNSLKFRPLVNRFELDANWDGGDPKEYYDNLEAGAIRLSDESGAGRYYSSNNVVGGIHRNFIPDANGFAYTQMIYENDGLGRVRAQGGVGEQFALKKSNGDLNETVTRFFYSTPEQAELVRLFGKLSLEDGKEISLAGDASHFQKQLVIDPNGQISVSYLDQEGRVRATGLYGDSPTNLNEIHTRERDLGTIEVDLSNGNKTESDDNVISRTIMNGDGTNDYKFTYALSNTGFTSVDPTDIYDGSTRTGTEFELDADYVVTIEVYDPDDNLVPIYTDANFNAASPNPDDAEKKENDTYGYDFGNAEGEVLTGKDLQSGNHTFTFNVRFEKLGNYTVVKRLQLQDNNADEIEGFVRETTAFDELEESFRTAVTSVIEVDSGCDDEFEDDSDGTTIAIGEEKNLAATFLDCENMKAQIQTEVDNNTNWNTLSDHPAYCFYIACLQNAPSKSFESYLQQSIGTWTEAEAAGLTDIETTAGILGKDPYFTFSQQGLDDMKNVLTADELTFVNGLYSFLNASQSGYDPTTLEGNFNDMKNTLGSITLTAVDPNDETNTTEVTGTLLELIDYDNPVDGLLDPGTGKNLLYGDMTTAEVDRQKWQFFVNLYLSKKLYMEAETRVASGCTYPDPTVSAVVFDPRPYLETSTLEAQNTNPVDDDFVEPDYEVMAEGAMNYYLNSLDQTCYDKVINPLTGERIDAVYNSLRDHLVGYFSAFPFEGKNNYYGSIYPEDVAKANGSAITNTDDPAYYLQQFTNELQGVCGATYVDWAAQTESKLDEILDLLPSDCNQALLNSRGADPVTDDHYKTIYDAIYEYYKLYDQINPYGTIYKVDVEALNTGSTDTKATYLRTVENLINNSLCGDGSSLVFEWEMVQELDPMECIEYEPRTVVSGIAPLAAYNFIGEDYADVSLEVPTISVNLLEDGTFIEVTVDLDLVGSTNGVFPFVSNDERFEFGFRVNGSQKQLYVKYLEDEGLLTRDVPTTQSEVIWTLGASAGTLTGCKTYAFKYTRQVVETQNCDCSHCQLLPPEDRDQCESDCLLDCVSNPTYDYEYFSQFKFYVLNNNGGVITASPTYNKEHWAYGRMDPSANIKLHETAWATTSNMINGYMQDVKWYKGTNGEPFGLRTYSFGGNSYPIMRYLHGNSEVTKVLGHWTITDPSESDVTIQGNTDNWNEGVGCINGLEYGTEQVCVKVRGEAPGGNFVGGGSGFTLTDLANEIEKECKKKLETQVNILVTGDVNAALQEIVAAIQTEHRENALEGITETLEYTYAPKDYHFTLYYYDQAGNLTQTVPPEGVDVLTQTELDAGVSEPNHRMKTRYAYNSLGQVTWQSTPDGGIAEFWYDSQGRLRISQNARQLARGKFSYTRYDEQGRVIEVGQIEKALDGSAITIAKTDDRLDDLSFPNALTYALDEQTLSHYDDIDELPYYHTGERPATEVFQPENLRGRVAWVEVKNRKHAMRMVANDPNSPLVPNAVMYDYDVHGNVRQILQLSFENRLVDYDYDLISGNVRHVEFHNETNTDRFIHRYEYDADNRVVAVETSTDGYTWFEDVRYLYYAHGPLARVEMGEYKVQGMDYYYSMQGWIKGVNAAGQSAEFDPGHDGYEEDSRYKFSSRDVYAYNLGYYEGDYAAIGGVNPDATTNWEPFKRDNTADKDILLEHTATGKHGLFNGNISLMATDLKYFGDKGIQMMAYQYDQLNRIRQAKSFQQTNGNWNSASNNFTTSYDYDGNGNLMHLNRYNGSGELMDQLSYHYYNRTIDGVTEQINRLRHVFDWGKDGAAPEYDFIEQEYKNGFNEETGGPDEDSGTLSDKDFMSQGSGNYEYDEIGNLIRDRSEGILSIEWSTYGKVKRVVKEDRSEVIYQYDPSGNRLLKRVKIPGKADKVTLYFRDASGNTLQVYRIDEDSETKEQFIEKEYSIYGSSRVGMYRSKETLTGERLKGVKEGHLTLGSRSYELSNHLGNVLTVITDNKVMATDAEGNIQVGEDGLVAYFEANIVSANDYYPFGLGMEERKYEDEEYRYGFNGKENDKDFGNKQLVQDYGFRMYNPAIGKFLSVDPMRDHIPWNTPYAFAENDVLRNIDYNGLIKVIVNIVQNGKILFTTTEEREIVEESLGISRTAMTININVKLVSVDNDDDTYTNYLVYESHSVDGGLDGFEKFKEDQPVIARLAQFMINNPLGTGQFMMATQKRDPYTGEYITNGKRAGFILNGVLNLVTFGRAAGSGNVAMAWVIGENLIDNEVEMQLSDIDFTQFNFNNDQSKALAWNISKLIIKGQVGELKKLADKLTEAATTGVKGYELAERLRRENGIDINAPLYKENLANEIIKEQKEGALAGPPKKEDSDKDTN